MSYQHIHAADAPKMVAEGAKLLGLKEIVGAKHNQTILAWGDELGIGNLVNDDEQAWCALFMAHLAKLSGKEIPMKQWDILRALQWARFGVGVKEPMLGDVIVFGREGGGHVALYVGEDASHYHVLGGNQGNQVSITRIEKKRAVAFRRPVYNNQPLSVKKYFVSSSGAPVSTSEA